MDGQPASRRTFLGHLGLTAAVAAGLVLAPSAAHAQGTGRYQSGVGGKWLDRNATFRCCVSTCRNCGPGLVAYQCTVLVSGCGSSYCTQCQTSRGTCYEQFGC